MGGLKWVNYYESIGVTLYYNCVAPWHQLFISISAVIDNADGSQYNPDGTRHTGGESSTSGVDEENAGSGSTHETTPMDASIRRSSPSYYGSPTTVSQLPDHTLGGGEKGAPGTGYGKDSRLPLISWALPNTNAIVFSTYLI